MHLVACALLFILTASSGVTAFVSMLVSISETAPGTSAWAVVTRYAFLSRRHFTERGWKLRGRAIRFQLLTMALMGILFLICAEF